MRGKLTPVIYHTVQPGITPADAGKTTEKRVSKLQNGDHPRGCGENLPTIIIEIVKSGSPPRMRGKPDLIPDCSRASRITPADAGKTYKSVTNSQSSEDHPRGCGENIYDAFLLRVGRGSPPRMRGKRYPSPGRRFRPGITPADAGKTRSMLVIMYLH
mgnify:FL=1